MVVPLPQLPNAGIKGVDHDALLPPPYPPLPLLSPLSVLALYLSKMKASVGLGYIDTLPAFLFLPVSFHKLGKLSYFRKLGGDNLEIV